MTSLSETLIVFFSQLHREDLVRMDHEVVEDRRVDRRRLIAGKAGQGGSLGSVPFAGGTQTSIQMDLERGRLRELAGRQLRGPLVEVVRDAHRADRM